MATMSRQEMKNIILHVARLKVEEADLWRAAHHRENRRCPTCGHVSDAPASREATDAHRAKLKEVAQYELFYYGQVKACGIEFGALWTISGGALRGGMDSYTLEDAIKAKMEEADHTIGVTYDSESGCLFIYTRTPELAQVVLNYAREIEPNRDYDIKDPLADQDYPRVDMGVGNWDHALRLHQNPDLVDRILDTIEGLSD